MCLIRYCFKLYTAILFAYADVDALLYIDFQIDFSLSSVSFHCLMNETVNQINIVLLIICLSNVNSISK